MSDPGVKKGADELFHTIRELGTCTKQDLVNKTRLSERTIRYYLDYLFSKQMVKEMPNIGRTKKYATVDYVPVLDESRPLAQRWQVYAPATNTRYTLGELATYYADEVPTASMQAAEYLFKAPALLVYYAQENELSDEEKEIQLKALNDVLGESIDQLQSAISVLNSLRTDPRLWRTDLLQMFAASPDYVLNSVLPRIIQRLRDENDNDDSSA